MPVTISFIKMEREGATSNARADTTLFDTYFPP
jgi:hypothetical protein